MQHGKRLREDKKCKHFYVSLILTMPMVAENFRLVRWIVDRIFYIIKEHELCARPDFCDRKQSRHNC